LPADIGPEHKAAQRSIRVLPLQHDGQLAKNTPPVLPDASSLPRKNIPLSETQKL
jgi:hypothetical protein